MKKLGILLALLIFYDSAFSQKVNASETISRQNVTAWLLSSNFTIPTVQFLPYTTKAALTKDGKGSVSFFNSLGAGVSLSKGNFTLLNTNMDSTGIDIKNHIGLQLGFVFSRSAGQENDVNRFALYTGISILDFQVGIGKEYGNISKDYKSVFYSVSYSIPLSKLSKKTTLVLKNKSGGNWKKLSSINKAFTI